jgi:hypothetical protein
MLDEGMNGIISAIAERVGRVIRETDPEPPPPE